MLAHTPDLMLAQTLVQMLGHVLVQVLAHTFFLLLAQLSIACRFCSMWSCSRTCRASAGSVLR